MRKSIPISETLILQEEKRLREQAGNIIAAKEIGISQQSIDKMIACFSISKAYYDDLKGRYEENGK